MILMFFTGIGLLRCYGSRFRRDLLFPSIVTHHPDAPALRHLAQPSSRHVQIGQRTAHKQVMGIPFQPAVTDLGKTEHAFDHRKDMLHLGPDFRLAAVACPGRLIQRLIATALLVGEVLGRRCRLANDRRLTGVSRIAPHPPLRAMQQVFQNLR
jgi:hypothetical protein